MPMTAEAMHGGVGLLGMLLIGLIAGYVAGKVTDSRQGLIGNLIVGIVGSFVGGTLANMFNIGYFGFLSNLIVATAGAVLVLFIWRKIRA